MNNEPGQFGGVDVSYTVQHRDECVLIFGSVPLRAMTALLKLAPDDAVMALDLARVAGANFAFGARDKVDALMKKLGPGELEKVRQQVRGLGLPDGAAEWLATGERGASSECMFQHLTGHAIGADECAEPSDPDDFQRCRKLVDQVPALRSSLHRMAELSIGWSRLVQSWDEICAAMDEEWGWPIRPKPGRANRTYELIKKATRQ